MGEAKVQAAQLWIATGNPSKLGELRDFAAEFLPRYGTILSRAPKDVSEDEPSFVGNAKLKAWALVRELLAEGVRDFAVLGDDSGLSVELLDGRPGVLSARYSGAAASPQKNLQKLLLDLEQKSTELAQRRGTYQCALSLVCVSGGRISGEFVVEGSRDGLIALTPKGEGGYAYDSIFLDPLTMRSYGEVSYEEKQSDSHRRRAFAKLSKLLGDLSR